MKTENRPAEVGDIVVKLTDSYHSSLKDGAKYAVLDVLNGDYSAIVLNESGELESLWYPDQYRVVGTVREKLKNMHANIKPAPKNDPQKARDFFAKIKKNNSE